MGTWGPMRSFDYGSHPIDPALARRPRAWAVRVGIEEAAPAASPGAGAGPLRENGPTGPEVA